MPPRRCLLPATRKYAMAEQKFLIQPHFPPARVGRRAEGLLRRRRPRLRLPGNRAVERRQGARAGRQVRRDAVLREGTHLGHLLRLPLDRERRGRQGPRQALWRCLFGFAVRRVRAAGFEDHLARAARRRADLGRLPVGQPLRDDPGARAVHAARPDQPLLQGGHAVRPHGPAVRGQDPGLHAVLGAVLLRRAARLPQGDRLHLHDGDA